VAINKLILLGGHIQALGLARQACKCGVPVYVCLKDAYSVARYSNSVKEFFIIDNDEKLEEKILSISDETTLLFPTSDDYIDYIVERYDNLNGKMQIGLPSLEVINTFNNKRNAYEYIQSLGVHQPISYCPNSFEDVLKLAETIEYPIVVKPAIMHSFHKQFGKKAYLCIDKESLIEKVKFIHENKYPINQVLLQEYLSGGAKTLYSYGVYAENGEPQAWIMANRIRQNPMDFGNSTTFAVTCKIPEIEEAARKILSATKYTGLAEIEFMYDEKNGVYKFLEINTRAWKWHSISKAFGWGFMSELIFNKNGANSEFVDSDSRNAWVERLTDFAVVLKELLKRKMKLKEVLNTYKISKTNAVWSIKDIKPAIMYLILSPILFIKRH
jgi:predicted ATP-grasp superfamily ATP-dependent carboligase